ncbi:hypothetical protein PAXINDRAFT_17375 [Paxillus involutus ATCC 200175]|uniref:Uncharacterized protein n=1 Tax=Paxillus involutus ATCC 200175 TaxID=664439 RepID=A0A0C9SQC7_PAXIN|nr:hypothetical protein PAXINDRAFT_17375 [Paxillus involutus ATCC 200175]
MDNHIYHQSLPTHTNQPDTHHPLLSPPSSSRPVPRVLTHSPLCSKSLSAQTPAANRRQPVPPLAPEKKRGRHTTGRHDENSLPLFDAPSHVPGPPLKKQRTSPKSWAQKLDIVLDTLKNIDWTVADLLYYLFRLRDQHNDPIHRSHRHAACSAIISSADGRIAEGSEESSLMYSTEVDYKMIRSICPALTSFAVQLVRSKLCSESSSALRQHDPLSTKPMEWLDIGQHTVTKAAAAIQKDQPVLWNLMLSLGLRQPHGTHRVTEQRRRRPVEGVSVLRM